LVGHCLSVSFVEGPERPSYATTSTGVVVCNSAPCCVQFLASAANPNRYLSNNFKVNFELELSRSPNPYNLKNNDKLFV
jgi:hypothetical protein